jgi:ectoine hydroxylase
MPEPHCVMTAVLLHKATAVNGPLLVIPGTHKLGMSEDVRPEADAKGYTVMEINESVVTDLAGKQGIEPVMGSAGTVAFIHCNLIHGSASNVSPWPRAIIYLNYNLVSNRPTGGNQRAWFHNNPNPAPLEVGSDQALAA